MNKELYGMCIGTLLGDAYVIHNTKSAFHRHTLRFGHSLHQKKYADYKASLFEKLGYHPYSSVYELKKPHVDGTPCMQYMIGINMKHDIDLIIKEMYNGNKKVVTMSVLKKLTPLGIALWVMDDGCLSFGKKEGVVHCRRFFLNTQGFSKEENEVIKEWFLETYNIRCSLVKNKEHYRLYFNASEYQKLVEIISPYICESMHYKICFRYEHNQKRAIKYNLCKNLCSGKGCHVLEKEA